MTLNVALTHKTEYHYDRLTSMGPQIIRLRPAPHSRTPILSYSLTIEPKDHFLNWQQDPFGNYLARLVMLEKTRDFSVTVDLVADMAVINPFNFFVDDHAKEWPFKYDDHLKKELGPYLEPIPEGPLFRDYLASLKIEGDTTIDFLVALNRQVQDDVKYLIRMEPGVQTPDETLARRAGSCRDSGWMLVQILRHYGLAARFVSGYLIQLKPDVKSLDGPAGTDVDFTDLHAWAEVYLPGAGWIGLDPTSGLLAGEGHIPLAATPSPISAAPITGGHEKAEVSFSFDMKVERIAESPRVTKPYTDDQWSAITQLGYEVDKRLQDGDVRLSMGGEPTFVAVDDMDGEEWNTAAVGPTKRHYAETLIRRLHDRFAPGGLLHFGQGKWYPGEQLPRWAFAVYWRADGEPLWQNPALIDSETPKKPATIEDAGRFIAALTGKLGLPDESAIPAYEDPAHFMLIERKLPVNVDTSDNKLDDPAERRRVMKVFERGLGEPASYVLPIQVWQSEERGRRWVTERWSFRREKLFLMPGDSPAGFRLPLGGLPHIAPINFPHIIPADPMGQQRPPLPHRETLLQIRRAATLEVPHATPDLPYEVEGSVRTAMTIEPRDGHLNVFMPPVEDAEDYAALVAAIEDAAAEIELPVHIEGYTPPSDSRLNVVKVTPDPGVIEVNIQPASDWDEAVDITTALYEEAHLTRLGTEKFMLDGRHSGTGGGNHIVLGGLTPADSPFLRRPDLLASLITYWQHHPSLSYLFSGLFIGPTSQAPRIDEARHEQLYEMEIALSQIPDPANGHVPPWLVDRIFRNLLIDVSGNTHRAEICIDKLYSPDGPTGRLGLVEFRSFEMPPHARMSLAQQLLLRALIARFWENPYKGKLVRWGTELHDRFMLPHFVWQDFLGIIDDLRHAGFPIEADWFAPHFEFRFPHYGTVEYGGLELELRQALEPWHVLGEEGVVGGTARYVDSSLERVQVKTARMTGERYTVTCNGHELPLTPTGTHGEFVAGIRYRAWQPPSALHPTIPTHVPLVFDVIDKWTGRSIGGCRYHVSHPGGRAFDTFPVNAYEAESRRLTRFETIGHTPGHPAVTQKSLNPEYPFTLDMRLQS
ncbi:MAG TPA: transglutaminase family protein [Hyphomicrobiales bacterium]|nr:transglutaminase family protein [Hyphomicrobiales bacterium]